MKCKVEKVIQVMKNVKPQKIIEACDEIEIGEVHAIVYWQVTVVVIKKK